MTASFAAAAAESAVKKMDKVLVLMALPGAVDLVNDVRASVHRETTKRVGVHVDRMKVLAGELWDKGRATTLSSTGQVPDAASGSLSLSIESAGSRDYSNGSPVDQEFDSFMDAGRAYQSLRFKCHRAELVVGGVVKESFGCE
jgi:hypothetical protein